MNTAERLANLTRDEARLRAEAVADVAYDIHLELLPAAGGYTGRCVTTFTAARADVPLFVDFVGRAVESIELNGQPVPLDAYRGPRIHLPPQAVRSGANRLEIAYACDYDCESVGFHHFADPADGREYTYTDFEPYDANRVFPCFDQPDLKAEFTVSVLAPRGWEVVSNTAPEAREERGERTLWRFAKTPRISTYLMNVCAGEYQVWEDAGARIPSRILARASLAAHVDADELFDVTRKGFTWYETYFDVKYPFGKYDQIFVPEFKTGAMENVGAVVVTDHVLFRHKPTPEERVDRAILLLHEMAHMWFGNLVTMRWWDGLWLNESFATYMSFLAAESVTDYQEIWQFFDARLRRWAVWQDELSTTHPIEMDVAETKGCFNNFDGITYGKGCCVLKQLVFRLGPEAFRKGVSAYLKKYSWKNTANLDFVRSLEEASGIDLAAWERSWLHTSGVNTLGCELDVVDGRIAGLWLRQSPGNGDGQLKEHRLKLGLFAETPAGYAQVHALDATVVGERSPVSAGAGVTAPAFVHPNLGSEAYAKVTLDARSLATVEAGLARFSDAGVRSGIIDILRSMLQDALLPAPRYLAILTAVLPGEPSSQILDALARSVPACLAQHLTPEARRAPAERVHAIAMDHVARAAYAPGVRRTWFRLWLGSAFAPDALARVRRVLEGGEVMGALTLDADMRWDLVSWLARREGDRGLVDAEAKRDATDRGERRAIGIHAALPDPAGKKAMWERFLTDQKTSLELLKSGFESFHQPDQEEALAPYAAGYANVVPQVARERSMEFGMAYVESLFPVYQTGDQEFAARLDHLIDKAGLPPALVRILRERRDDYVRLARIRAAAR
jgi:aminopeptidase N